MDMIEGRAWVLGNNVDTNQITLAERLVAANLDYPNDYIFEKVRPGLTQQVQKGNILVVGRNFGCRPFREHAPLSLIEAGFFCIIAESFTRIFYGNSMNTGPLLVECKVDVKEGETAEVYPDNDKVVAESGEYAFPEYPPFVSELIKAGGLVNLVKERRF